MWSLIWNFDNLVKQQIQYMLDLLFLKQIGKSFHNLHIEMVFHL